MKTGPGCECHPVGLSISESCCRTNISTGSRDLAWNPRAGSSAFTLNGSYKPWASTEAPTPAGGSAHVTIPAARPAAIGRTSTAFFTTDFFMPHLSHSRGFQVWMLLYRSRTTPVRSEPRPDDESSLRRG